VSAYSDETQKPTGPTLPSWISKYVQSTYDPPGDGNCGYHCIAHQFAAEQPDGPYAKSDGWHQVRTDLLEEMTANKSHWTGRLGSAQEFSRVFQSLKVDRDVNYVPKEKWMSNLDIGPIVANRYNMPVIFASPTGSMTYLPTTKAPDAKPRGPIFLAFINTNHWILVNVKRGLIPYPPVSGLPRTTRGKPIEGWLEIVRPSLDLHNQPPPQ
jgi:hypothetical protein